MEKYLFNPDLPFVDPDYKGNRFKNGEFSNYPWPDTDASFGRVLRWIFTPNPQKKEKKNDNYKPGLVKDESLFDI